MVVLLILASLDEIDPTPRRYLTLAWNWRGFLLLAQSSGLLVSRLMCSRCRTRATYLAREVPTWKGKRAFLHFRTNLILLPSTWKCWSWQMMFTLAPGPLRRCSPGSVLSEERHTAVTCPVLCFPANFYIRSSVPMRPAFLAGSSCFWRPTEVEVTHPHPIAVVLHSMVYMSRMPVGGKEGQSRLGKRIEDGPKQSEGADGSTDTSQGLEAERESNNVLCTKCIYGGYR